MKISTKMSLAIGVTLLVSIGCSAASKNDFVEEPRVHNLAPKFIEFWGTVQSRPIDEQLAELKKNFFPEFAQFYRYKIEKWKEVGKNPDKELKKQLAQYPEIEEQFIRKTKEITNKLDSTLESFVVAIPGLDRNFDVYITHSFGEMDGGSREIDGTTYFILGIDGMVNYHQGFVSETPFFHHELFHVYHSQYFPEEQVMWIALWAEGLATYASEKLNPKASFKDLLLDLPEGMVKRIENDIAFHWNDLKSKLKSTNEDDYESYFSVSSEETRIVTRAGYYLGYLLAKEIGKTKSLSEMAQMEINAILPTLEEKIEELCSEGV